MKAELNIERGLSLTQLVIVSKKYKQTVIWPGDV